MNGSNEHAGADTNAGPGSGTDPTDGTSESGATEQQFLRTVLVVGAIASVGIVVTGVMVNLLERVGPSGSADIMWILGYGMTIFVLWYLFVRPIDFSKRYSE